MSTDRKLLELAAKASKDHKIYWNGAIWANQERMTKPDSRGDSYPCEWNPLTDDGDALRLAVKLNLLRAYVYEDEISLSPSEHAIVEPCNGDPCAAIRRAIVRAAAEIGEAMP